VVSSAVPLERARDAERLVPMPTLRPPEIRNSDTAESVTTRCNFPCGSAGIMKIHSMDSADTWKVATAPDRFYSNQGNLMYLPATKLLYFLLKR
jgi:hypothetical protein